MAIPCNHGRSHTRRTPPSGSSRSGRWYPACWRATPTLIIPTSAPRLSRAIRKSGWAVGWSPGWRLPEILAGGHL